MALHHCSADEQLAWCGLGNSEELDGPFIHTEAELLMHGGDRECLKFRDGLCR